MADANGSKMKRETLKQGLLLLFVGISFALVLLLWGEALAEPDASTPAFVRPTQAVITRDPAYTLVPAGGDGERHNGGGGQHGRTPARTPTPAMTAGGPTPTETQIPLVDQ